MAVGVWSDPDFFVSRGNYKFVYTINRRLFGYLMAISIKINEFVVDDFTGIAGFFVIGVAEINAFENIFRCHNPIIHNFQILQLFLIIDTIDLIVIIAKMSRVDRAAALGLALNMLVAPTVNAGDQPPTPIVEQGQMPPLSNSGLLIDQKTTPQDVPASQEVDRAKYQLALDTMGKLVEIDSNPITQAIYQRAVEKPEEFIEIVDPSGTKEHYVPNFYSYYVYSQPTVGKNPDEFRAWSIQMRIEDSTNDVKNTLVFIQLNSSGHVFKGLGDIVAPLGGLSLIAKALQSDYLFNIPSGMQLEDWVEDLDPESGYLYRRQYPDGNGGMLTQKIGLGNVILLEANFPPQELSQN